MDENALEQAQEYQFNSAEDLNAPTVVREGEPTELKYQFRSADELEAPNVDAPTPTPTETAPVEAPIPTEVAPIPEPQVTEQPLELPEVPLEQPLTVDQTGAFPSVPGTLPMLEDTEPLQPFNTVPAVTTPDQFTETTQRLQQERVQILEQLQGLSKEVTTPSPAEPSGSGTEDDRIKLDVGLPSNIFSNPTQGFEPPQIYRSRGAFGRDNVDLGQLPAKERVGYRYAENWFEALYLRQRPTTSVELEAERAGTFIYDRYEALNNIIPGAEAAIAKIDRLNDRLARLTDQLIPGEGSFFEDFVDTFGDLEQARYGVNSGLIRGIAFAPLRFLGTMYGLTIGGILDYQLNLARNNLVSKDNAFFSDNLSEAYVLNRIDENNRDVWVNSERYEQMIEELILLKPERREEFAGTLRRLEQFNRLIQPSFSSNGNPIRPNVAMNIATYGMGISNIGTNYEVGTGERFSLGIYGKASNGLAGTLWGFRLFDPEDSVKNSPSSWYGALGYSFLTTFRDLALEILNNPVELLDLGVGEVVHASKIAQRKRLYGIAAGTNGVDKLDPVFLDDRDVTRLESLADALDDYADSLPTKSQPFAWGQPFEFNKFTTPDFAQEREVAREMAQTLRKKAEEAAESVVNSVGVVNPREVELASRRFRQRGVIEVDPSGTATTPGDRARQMYREQEVAAARQRAGKFNGATTTSQQADPLVRWEDTQIDLTQDEAWDAYIATIRRGDSDVPPLTDEEVFLLDQVTGTGTFDELEIKTPKQLYDDYLDSKVEQFRQQVEQTPTNVVEPALDLSVQADIAKMRQLGDEVIQKFNNRVAELYEEQAARTVSEVEAERQAVSLEQTNKVYRQVLDELELDQYKLPETELDKLLPEVQPEQLLLSGTEEVSQPTLPGFVPKGLLTGSDADAAVKLNELMTGDEYLNKFYSDLLDEPPNGDAYLDEFYSDLFEPLTELVNPTVAQSLDAISTVAEDVADVLSVLDSFADNAALQILSDTIEQYAPGGEQALSDALNALIESLPPSGTQAAVDLVDNLGVESKRLGEFLDNMTSDILAENDVVVARVEDGLTGFGQDIELSIRNLADVVSELKGKSRQSLEAAAQYLDDLRQALQAQKFQIGEMLDQAIVTVGRNMDESGLQRLVVMANELGIFDVARFNDSVLEWLDGVYANLNIIDVVKEGAWVPPQFIDGTGRIRPSRVVQEFSILNQLPPVKVIVPPSLPDFSLQQLQDLANFITGKAQVKGKRRGTPRQEYVRQFETGTVVTPLDKTFTSVGEARVSFADYLRSVLKTADSYRVGSFSNMGQARDILLQAAKWLGVENARYAGFYRLRTELEDMLRQLDRTIPTLDITEATRIDVARTKALQATGRLGQPPLDVAPKTYDNIFRLAGEMGGSTDDISQAALVVFDQAKEYARMLQAGEFKNKTQLYDAITSLGQYAKKSMTRAELEQALQVALEPYSWYFTDPTTIYIPSKVGVNLDDIRTAHGVVTGYTDRTTAELAAQAYDSSLPIDAPREYTVLEVSNYSGRRISPNKWDIDTADVVSVTPVEQLDNTVAAKYAKVQAAMRSYSDVKQPFTDTFNQIAYELAYESDIASREVYLTAAREYTERLDNMRRIFDEAEEFTFTRHDRQLKAAASAPKRTNSIDLASYIDLERRKQAAIEAGDWVQASKLEDELTEKRAASGHNNYTSGTIGDC